jgi:predicted ester cyclase
MLLHKEVAMSTEEHKDIVRRWVDAWNTNTNYEVIDQIFATDWMDRNPLPTGPQGGIEGARFFVSTFRSAFSDIHLTIDLLLAEEDWVMFRWVATARHTGQFMGIAPTEREVTFSGITVHRVANGKFAESVGETDLLGLVSQLRTS